MPEIPPYQPTPAIATSTSSDQCSLYVWGRGWERQGAASVSRTNYLFTECNFNTSAVQLYQMWSSCGSHPHPNPRTISLPARANSPSKQCFRSYSHLTATSTLIAFTSLYSQLALFPGWLWVVSLRLKQLTSTSPRRFSVKLLCWCTTAIMWCHQNLRMPFLVAKSIIFTEQITSCTE